LESLAKLMGTPQINSDKQLRLILREVEIKTTGRAPTGKTYEHPSKDKLDFQNPIDKIINDVSNCHHRCKFGSKNGEVTDIKSKYELNKISNIPQD